MARVELLIVDGQSAATITRIGEAPAVLLAEAVSMAVAHPAVVAEVRRFAEGWKRLQPLLAAFAGSRDDPEPIADPATFNAGGRSGAFRGASNPPGFEGRSGDSRPFDAEAVRRRAAALAHRLAPWPEFNAELLMVRLTDTDRDLVRQVLESDLPAALAAIERLQAEPAGGT